MVVAKLDKDKIQEKLENGYMRVRAIVEMVGGPKEYIVKTLKLYIDKISQDRDIIVLKEKYSKPKKVDKLFSLFVEVEMLVKDAKTLAFFCFDYMPASIEIMEPNTFIYKAADFAAFFNDMQARLHRLDYVIKELTAKTKVLERNAGLLLRNNIITLLKEKDKKLEEMAGETGIPAEQLKPFLTKLANEGWLKEEGNKYILLKKRLKKA